MKELDRYDYDLQMFVDTPRNPDIGYLRLLRFQAERGDFGYKPISVPRGDNVFRLTDAEIRKYAMQEADSKPPLELAIQRHIASTGGY